MNKPRTHWHGCWEDHHECAVARLKEAIEFLKVIHVYDDDEISKFLYQLIGEKGKTCLKK